MMRRLGKVVERVLKNESGQDVALPQKLLEIGYLYLKDGLGPGYYLEAEIGRKDRDRAYKFGFYGHRDYLKRLDEVNDPRYGKIPQNKLVEAAMLTTYGIRTPALLGHLCKKRGIDTTGKPLRTGSDLRRLLDEQNVSRFCAKIVEGWSGKGFVGAEVLRDDEIRLRLLDSKEVLTCEEFVERYDDYSPAGGRILQRFLDQHHDMAALNPSSVNTIRVLVFAPSQGPTRIIGGYARIGRAGSLVDNTGSGGFWAVVDTKSGTLEAGRTADPAIRYRSHPDHGGRIEGVVVPFWNDALELASRTVDVFPAIRYLGLDVAIAPDGPVIIEVNNRPDYHAYAVLQTPPREAMRD